MGSGCRSSASSPPAAAAWSGSGSSRSEAGLEPASAPVNGTAAELAGALRASAGPVVVAGELTAMQREQIAKVEGVILPAAIGAGRRVAGVAALGRRRYERGDVDDAAALGPAYVHAAASSASNN